MFFKPAMDDADAVGGMFHDYGWEVIAAIRDARERGSTSLHLRGVSFSARSAPAIIAMWFPPERQGAPMGIWATWLMALCILTFLPWRAIIPADSSPLC